MKLKVALGQMDVKLGRPAANLATARRFAAEAVAQGVELLVLPELWSTGYDLENAADYATTIDAGVFAQTAALAAETGLHIAGSCLSDMGEGQFGNTLVWFGPDGVARGSYSKVHLFRLMDEHRYLTAGDRLTSVDTPWGRAGLGICYDLRFPELFRAYALDGATLVLLPSEWPHPRLAHWRTLLRARAIENQLFMIACNRVGTSKDTDFFGHSTIVDPWGETVLELGETEELGVTTLDFSGLPDTRAFIPIFTDRRPDLY